MRTLLLIPFVLIILSCSKGDYLCIDCETKSNTFQLMNEFEGIVQFYLPNIINTDFPADNYFGLQLSLFDTVNLAKDVFFPDTISVMIYNSYNKLIYESTEVVTDPGFEATVLWNGMDSGVPYRGDFFYSLYCEKKDKLILEVEGEGVAVSCEDIENCTLEDVDCDLTNCRYFPLETLNQPVIWNC